MFLKYLLSPTSINTINELHSAIRYSESFSFFLKNILSFIRSSYDNIFNCNINIAITLPSGFRVGLSHLCGYKLKYSFPRLYKSTTSIYFRIESASHYVFHCLYFYNKRHIFLNKIRNKGVLLLS